MQPAFDISSSQSVPEARPFWLTPAAYWVPPHLPVSAWYTHTPFAAWLIDVLRPEVVAELGTHFGCSCFAFAEAAKRLGHGCTIHAVDTWQGDDHAGYYGQEVFDDVSRVAEADYGRSVRLVRARFDEARQDFADGSLDLLHIDGRHGYEDVRADYLGWLPAVRDGGVILFHDIAERENGFGVWRLWEQIAQPGRSFAFEHGHGLGVLAVGDVRVPELRALFEADEDTGARIRADFARLGAEVERKAWLETLPAELESVHEELARRSRAEQELQQRLDAQTAHIDVQAARIDALEHSTSWRVTAPLRALGRLRRGDG
jgi:hypothetical protein